MAFNPKYSSIPMVSDNIGMPDLPITFPSGEVISQSCQDETITNLRVIRKGGAVSPSLIIPNTYYSLSILTDYIGILAEIGGNWWKSLPFQRKIEQQNVVVKYDDEVGTIIPLSQKQFDVLTFTTQPMNADYARLLLDIAEWDNVTFQHWDLKNNTWSTALNVAKKAESWQKTTYPKTLGTTIQGSFIIKQ